MFYLKTRTDIFANIASRLFPFDITLLKDNKIPPWYVINGIIAMIKVIYLSPNLSDYCMCDVFSNNPTPSSITLHAFRKPAKDKAVMPKYARLSTFAFLALKRRGSGTDLTQWVENWTRILCTVCFF